jgi:DNA-binding beta-propeller fold protein YncE
VPLGGLRTATVAVPGQPASVLITRDGRWSFVSTPAAVLVLANGSLAPTVVARVALPAAVAFGPHGMSLTADGRYLLAAAGSGAVVIDVARAERGASDAVLGRLRSRVADADAGAIAVASSRDGRFVFVARARAGGVVVFDLQAALSGGFGTDSVIGAIPTDFGPSALAVAPGGRWLYVTSVAARGPSGSAPAQGTLSVVDVAAAERAPAGAVRTTISAGCEPVSVTTSAGGAIVWVSALGSHSVLGYSASQLLVAPAGALVAAVTVGRSPYGLASAAGGTRLLVADGGPGGGLARRGPGVSVIDTSAALGGRPALLGSLVAGVAPRGIAIDPRRRIVLVADYGSDALEAISVAGAL